MYLLHFENFSTWVTMDDRAREVYSIEKRRSNNITCWIASEPGKKFGVNWHNDTRAFPLQGVVVIDGVICNNHIMLDAASFPDKPNSIGVSFARASDFTCRDFMFTTIEVTDDDAFLHTIGQTNNFGTVTLELWRFQSENVVSQSLELKPGRPVLEGQVVHERSKKAGTHHVKCGEEYFSPSSMIDIASGQKLGHEPYVTFTFRYRPMALLMANGIVPQAVPPPANPTACRTDEETVKEIRRLKARLKALHSKVKLEQSDTPSLLPSTSRRIKAEPSMAARSRIARQPAEVIDLTGVLDD